MHNISETVQHKPVHHHHLLALAALGLALVVALAGAITFLYRAANPAATRSPTTAATPITSSAWSGHNTAMTIKDGVAYIGTVDHAVYALRLRNGKLLWRQSINDAVDTTPIVAENGIVYFSSFGYTETGTIFALRASDGALLWQHADDLISGALISGNTIYLSTESGFVSALRTHDGSRLWSYRIFGAVSEPVNLVGGVAHIGAANGIIYALRASNGTLLWYFTTKVNYAGGP